MRHDIWLSTIVKYVNQNNIKITSNWSTEGTVSQDDFGLLDNIKIRMPVVVIRLTKQMKNPGQFGYHFG